MEKILIFNPDTNRKIVVGYFENNTFLKKQIIPSKHFNSKYKGYCLSQEMINILKNKDCLLVHFEICEENNIPKIIESEFEDWLISVKYIKDKNELCLPLKFWRDALQSDRIDGNVKKTKKQEKLEKMATINMHSKDEIRFCRKCEEYTGNEPVLNCKSGRFWTGKTNVPTKRKVQVLFLGESPWKDEIADPEGRFLIGRSGEELDDLIYEAGIDPKGVYVDNVVRCAFPRTMGGYETVQRGKIRNNCSVYLFSELDRLKPEIIVPMGNMALQALLGVNSITRWTGRHILYLRLRNHIVPIVHPAAILRQPHLRSITIDQLKFIKSLIGTPAKFKPVKDIFILDDLSFDKCMSELEQAKEFTIDIETIGADNYSDTAQIIGIALCTNIDKGYFLPLWDFKQATEDGVNIIKWNFNKLRWTSKQIKRFKKILKDKRKLKIFHNAGFDLNWLLYFGFDVTLPIYDTIIGNSVLDDIDNGLKELAWLHTDFGGYENELKESSKYKKNRMDEVDPFILAKYGAYDGIATKRVKVFQDSIIDNHNAKDLLPELMELRYNLSKVELDGCKIDVKKVKELKIKYEDIRRKLERDIKKDLGIDEININSTKQIVEVLYGYKGILNEFKVKASTDKRVLTEILRVLQKKKNLTVKNQKQKRIIENILEYRKYGKLVSTYLGMFLEQHDKDKRVHTHYTVFVARTGRLSSKEPDLQNIPRESEMRDCFIADLGCDLIEWDYNQLELRIAAEYSRDEKMLSILNDVNGDIHSQVGVLSIKRADGTNYPIEDFYDKPLRPKAKIISFSVIYGKTAMSLAYDLDCSVAEAARIQRFMFDGFPGLRNWIYEQQAFLTKYGYVENLFGRQYYISGAFSNRQEDIEAAYRKAVNYPIQGSASDVLVLAYNRLNRKIEKNKLPVKMSLTVHDSLLFNVEKNFTKKFIPLCREELERPIKQIKYVKLYADCKKGYRWGSLKDVKRII